MKRLRSPATSMPPVLLSLNSDMSVPLLSGLQTGLVTTIMAPVPAAQNTYLAHERVAKIYVFSPSGSTQRYTGQPRGVAAGPDRAGK